MNKKASHIQKTKEERQHYIKLIDQTHPDPTIDEQPTEFDPSNAVGKEKTELLTDTVRQPPMIDQIREYVINHWLEWAFAILVVALVYFVTDSRLRDVDHGKSIEFHEKQIDEIKVDNRIQLEKIETKLKDDIEDQQQKINLLNQVVENINSSITDLKLVTNELLIKFEFLEKKIDN